MKIGVIGPGAIGCVFAATLKGAGHSVCLVDYKEERAQKLAQSGLEVIGQKGIIKESLSVHLLPEVKNLKKDLWILTVKNHSLNEILPILQSNPYSSTLLPLQNGLGVREKLESCFPPGRVLMGLTRMGAHLVEWGKVRLASWGRTLLDGNHLQSTEVQKIFSQSQIPVVVTPEIEEAIWQKALINSAINPLTALWQVKNGSLLHSEEAQRIMKKLIEEGQKVARAEGKVISDSIFNTVREVLEETKENFSSMAQDVARGKKTEIDSLNGYLAQKAKEHGLAAPVQWTLFQLIKFSQESGKIQKKI